MFKSQPGKHQFSPVFIQDFRKLGMKASACFGIWRPSWFLDKSTGLFPELVISLKYKTSSLTQSKATCVLSTEVMASVLL